MRRNIGDNRRGPALLLWILFSSGLTIRNLRLAAHGGGATPKWLLGAETLCFSLSTLSGLAALKSPPQATEGAGARGLMTATTAVGAVAVVIHGVRVAVYLRAGMARQG